MLHLLLWQMGAPGALHRRQLLPVWLVEVEDVELVRVVLVLGQVKVFWLVSEHPWVGQGCKPSGLRSELQVPAHGHAKQTAPFQETGYTLLRRVGEHPLSGWAIRPAKVHWQSR